MLAEDNFEISMLFRDWINVEERNQGLSKLNSQYELFIDSTIRCGSDDDVELQDTLQENMRLDIDVI